MNATGPTIERLLTPAEVAERLGCCQLTVRRLSATGRLPRSISLGTRLVRYRERDIDAFIARGGVRPVDNGCCDASESSPENEASAITS